MSSTTSTTTPTTPSPRTATPDWRTIYNTARKPGGQLHDLAVRTAERVAFEAKPCGGTAAWRWDATAKKRGYSAGQHHVTLDPTFAMTLDRRSNPPRRLRLAYGHALLRHEKWHGLRTMRDLERLARDADRIGVPFPLLNFAEDLRIEHLARREEKTQFHWDMYNHSPTRGSGAADGVVEPLQWLAGYIWREVSTSSTRHDPTLDRRWKGAPETARVRLGVAQPTQPTVDVLNAFAVEFADALDTDAVLLLCRDWVETFPTAKHNPADIPGIPARHGYGVGYTSGNGDGSGAPPTAPTQYGQPFKTVDPRTLPSAERKRLEYFTGMTADWLAVPNEEYAKRSGRDLPDVSAASSVAQRLTQLLGSVEPSKVRTATSGGRVHVRGVMTGDPSSFRQVQQRTGKRRIVAVFDQSGSMCGDWHRHGATFASALLMLHRRGVIDVTVILTGGRSYCVVPPMLDPSLVARFHCRMGNESVDATLDAHKALLQGADTVLIYTDGHLTDGDVDAGRWRSLGVDLVGCAVTGSSHVHDMLVKHFARGITAESGAQLATRITQYIATRK
jgi:hypothetical protein